MKNAQKELVIIAPNPLLRYSLFKNLCGTMNSSSINKFFPGDTLMLQVEIESIGDMRLTFDVSKVGLH
jgi:hypothetical protein